MLNETVQQLKQEAHNLYKSKQYKGALDLYRKLFDEYKSECNEWDIRYYAWCIYYVEIKDKKNEEIVANENLFFKSINEVLNLFSDKGEMAYNIAIFKVLNYLESKVVFPANEIINWTDKLVPDKLSKDCYTYTDKEGPRGRAQSEHSLLILKIQKEAR